MLSPRLKTLFMSVSAQGVWSGGNFLLNVVMIRWLDAADYGVFVVSSTLVYFLSGYLAAAHVTPEALAEREVDRAVLVRRYGGIAAGLFSLRSNWVPLAIALATMLFVLFQHAPPAEGWPMLSVAYIAIGLTCVAAAASLAAREACVRFAYISGSQQQMLVSNIVAIIGGAVLVWLATHLGKSVLAGSLVFAAATYISYIVLARGMNLPGRGHSIPDDSTAEQRQFKKTVAHNGVVAHIVISLRSYGYVYLVPLVAGLPAVAQLNASRLTIAVAVALTPVFSQLMTAYLLKMRGAGEYPRARLSYCFLGTAVVVCTGLATLVLLGIFAPETTRKFGGGNLLASLWLVYVAVSTPRVLMEAEILLNHPQIQGRSNTVGCIVAVGLIFPLVSYLGAAGALVSLIVSELVVVAWYLIARRSSEQISTQMALDARSAS